MVESPLGSASVPTPVEIFHEYRAVCRIQHIEDALAARVVVAGHDQRDPAVAIRLDQRRGVEDVAQFGVGELPQHAPGRRDRGFGIGGRDRSRDVERIDRAAAGAQPTDQQRAPVVAGLRRRAGVGVGEIDVPGARCRVDVELVREGQEFRPRAGS